MTKNALISVDFSAKFRAIFEQKNGAFLGTIFKQKLEAIFGVEIGEIFARFWG